MDVVRLVADRYAFSRRIGQLTDLVARADRALYAAETAGKNCGRLAAD